MNDDAPPRPAPVDAFTLLHEFDEAHDRFDWHVDTKPNDGKARTTNLNVMLSEPRVDFGGGNLQVGSHNVSVRRGDAYAYAAAAPHVVHPLAWGLRRTLVVALNTAADDDRAEGARGCLDLNQPRPFDVDISFRVRVSMSQI